jgi:hypothetical protein
VNQQLRSHIAIAAPARREAADGTESPLRVVLGFEPRWFHARCGVDFGERWHRDPEYRRGTLLTMRAELQRAFPGTRQWSGEEARDVDTIGGCFGVGVMPAVFGMPLRFYPDRWPHPEPGHELSDGCIVELDPARLLASPFVAELLAQVDTMAGRWGAVHGEFNWQGVLNTAFQVRGQQIFVDMAERPELAARLFEVIAETTIRLARTVQERQRRSGFAVDWMCVSNCTLSMISPAMYRRLLLPLDARIARAFQRFGVHTCNWNATPYLSVLRELPSMGYLDMGESTDFAAAKTAFPDARRAVLYTPGKLAGKPPDIGWIQRVWRELAPCDVVLADIPWDMPDIAVNDFLRLAHQAGATPIAG